MLEEAGADPVLDFGHRIAELLRHRLSLQCVDGVGVRRGGHNNERYDCRLRARFLKAIVEA